VFGEAAAAGAAPDTRHILGLTAEHQLEPAT
jgi:hypothetical protein